MSKEVRVAGSKIYTVDDNGNCDQLAPNELLISDEHFNIMVDTCIRNFYRDLGFKYKPEPRHLYGRSANATYPMPYSRTNKWPHKVYKH